MPTWQTRKRILGVVIEKYAVGIATLKVQAFEGSQDLDQTVEEQMTRIGRGPIRKRDNGALYSVNFLIIVIEL